MYAKIFNNLVNPFYESVVKRRETYNYLNRLLKSQNFSLAINKKNSLDSLRLLLSHSSQHCPYYRDLFQGVEFLSLSDEALLSTVSKIPFLTKQIINSYRDELVAENYKNSLWSKSTGGSTGVPLHFCYTKDSNDWRVASTWRGYGWAGANLGVKQAYIWGSHLGDIPKIKRMKEALHHSILRQRYYNCFQFDEKAMVRTLEDLNNFRPKVVVGYTNPLYSFASFVKEQQLKINFLPTSVITAAEALHDYQRELIEDVFKCKIFHTYGSREFMLIASECERHEGLHINVENIYLEVVRADGTSADFGEVGEIVITDLHNYGMPFIRYKICDLGVLSEDDCSCGRGLPMLKKVVGRSLDMLKTKNGRLIPGEFFPHLFKDFKNIKQFQVVQNNIDSLDIHLVVDSEEDVHSGLIPVLSKAIGKITGGECVVNYNFADDIPLTQTGKRRVTICNI